MKSVLNPMLASVENTRTWTRDAVLIGLVALIAAGIFRELEPAMLLLALLGFAATAALFSRPQYAVIAGLAILYLNLPAVLAKHYGVPTWIAGASVLLLAVPLVRRTALVQRPPFADRVLFLMVVAYLPLITISALLSEQPAESGERLVAYATEGFLVYFLVLNAVTSRALLRKAAWTLVLAGALMGGISVIQESTKTYYSSYGGLAQVVTHDEETGEVTRPRLAGPIGEKNRYAQVLVVLLPLVVLLASTEPRRLRTLALAAGLLILGGIVLTFSRAAAVTAGASLFAMLALGQVRWRQVVLAGLVLLVLVPIVAPAYVQRLASLSDLSSVLGGETRAVDGAMKGRATENLAAWKVFLDHPLLGVGTGQTRLYVARYGQEDGLRRLVGTRRAHSMYLEELSDTGVLGFSCLMLMIGIALHRLWNLRRHVLVLCPADATWITAILLVLCTYLVSAVFLHLSYIRYFWLLMALAAVAARIFSTASDADPQMQEAR